MQKYVSIKSNKLIQNVSDDQQDGFVAVQVPDTKLQSLYEYPSACWVENQNGTNIIHIPDSSDLPNDEFDDLKQTVQDQETTISNLKSTVQNINISSLQDTVNTLQKDVSNQPDDSDLKKQVSALGSAIVTIQKQQAAANQETTKSSANQSNGQQTNQATQNK